MEGRLQKENQGGNGGPEMAHSGGDRRPAEGGAHDSGADQSQEGTCIRDAEGSGGDRPHETHADQRDDQHGGDAAGLRMVHPLLEDHDVPRIAGSGINCVSKKILRPLLQVDPFEHGCSRSRLHAPLKSRAASEAREAAERLSGEGTLPVLPGSVPSCCDYSIVRMVDASQGTP